LTITQRIKTQLGTVKPPLKNWVFLGLGYTAKALITHLPADIKLTGTSRTPDKWPDDLKARVQGVKFDGHISSALRRALSEADVVIMSQPPSAAGDPFLSAIDGAITALAPRVKWAGYLSATSVYGDRNGDWAFEHEPPSPGLARGTYRADAEIAWLESGLPIHVFRLAGIYGGSYFGQSRDPFRRLESGDARAVIKQDHIVNRIHAEDIAQAITASIAAPNPVSVYNVADNCPAAPQDVLRFAARLCGAPLPPEVSVDSPEISDMARSFYAETKRVSNTRLSQELGWEPLFPNYQKGLMSIYKSSLNNPKSVILAGHMDVPPARRRIIAEALPRHIRLSRAEAGCQRFDIAEDIKIAGRYHLTDIFKSKAAFAAHQKRSAASDWAAASQGVSRHYYKL
jgi:nucleoside-diphosphate-sugar epimerase